MMPAAGAAAVTLRTTSMATSARRTARQDLHHSAYRRDVRDKAAPHGRSGMGGFWRQHQPGSLVALGALRRHLLAGDDVVDRLGDVGGVVADAFDVLGAKQKMRA